MFARFHNTLPFTIPCHFLSQKSLVNNSIYMVKISEHDFLYWRNCFEFPCSRTWMTTSYRLPFVLRVIMMNLKFIPSSNIQPLITILVEESLTNIFLLFLYGICQLSWDPSGTDFSVIKLFFHQNMISE